MSMTFVLVPTPEDFEIEQGKLLHKLIGALFEKETFIALGDLRVTVRLVSYFDCTSFYFLSSIRWYVPCSVKYPRWSNIFAILSVEL